MSFHNLKKALIHSKDSLRHLISRLRYDFETSEEKLNIKELKQAVIHRADGKLGDAICFMPFIRELKRFAPDCRIIILSNKNTAEIYQSADFIDEVILFPKKPKNNETDAFADRLKGTDLYIHLFDTLKGRHLRLISRMHPKWVATLDRSLKCDNLKIHQYTACIDDSGNSDEKYSDCLHMTDLLFKILENGGISPELINRGYCRLFADRIPGRGEKYAFLKSPAAPDKINDVTEEKTVIFNPFGASSSRRFSERIITEIIDMLLKLTSAHIVLWTGPGDREYGEKIIGNIFAGNSRVSTTGVLSSASEIIIAMASCDAMIGVDTGSAHAAACFDIPELTFYSSNMVNYSRWYARAPGAVNVILDTGHFGNADENAVSQAVKSFVQKIKL